MNSSVCIGGFAAVHAWINSKHICNAEFGSSCSSFDRNSWIQQRVNQSVIFIPEKKNIKIKPSIYSSHFAEAYNECRGPSTRLSACATQLRRNVAAVANVGDIMSDLTGPGIELQIYRTDCVCLRTELTSQLPEKITLNLHCQSWYTYNGTACRLQSILDGFDSLLEPVAFDECRMAVDSESASLLLNLPYVQLNFLFNKISVI